MRSTPTRWVLSLTVTLLTWPLASTAQDQSGLRADFVAVARGGVVVHSSDGGATWSETSPTTGYINGVASDNRGRFVAVGARGTILLSESGTAWREVSSGVDAGVTLNAVAWDDDGTFVAVGSEGAVYASHDGGLTWTRGDSGVEDNLLSVDTDRAGTWIAGGAQAIVLRSTDEGAHWQQGTLAHGEHGIGVAALGNGRWVAVGPMGSAAISNDGGVSWSPVQTGVDVVLEGVAADTTGVVVG